MGLCKVTMAMHTDGTDKASFPTTLPPKVKCSIYSFGEIEFFAYFALEDDVLKFVRVHFPKITP